MYVSYNCEPMRSSPLPTVADTIPENQIKANQAQGMSHYDKRNVFYLPQFLFFSSKKHFMHVPEVSKTQAQHNAQAMWFNDF